MPRLVVVGMPCVRAQETAVQRNLMQPFMFFSA
jgi:hypothetical protein